MEGMEKIEKKVNDGARKSINKKRNSLGTEKAASSPVRAEKKSGDDDPPIPRRAKKGRKSGEDASRNSKKNLEALEAENIHVESQRLLRETKGVAFKPEPLMQKPVTSLIEKLRLRKLQVCQSATKLSAFKLSNLDHSKVFSRSKALIDDTELNHEIEFVTTKPPNEPAQVVMQESDESSTVCTKRTESMDSTLQVDDVEKVGEGAFTRPSTPDIQHGSSILNSKCKSLPRSLLCAALMDSQDQFSDSHFSFLRDESSVEETQENTVPAVGMRLNLRLDSETQDDSSWLEVHEKERKVPTTELGPEHFPTVSHVRGLVDDEAEDEDDDPLEDDDENEDEDEDAAGDLHDLVTQDAGEQQADIEHRAELHSKWLEQQDLDVEDNILHRIESGWKRNQKEIPEFLKETHEIGFTGNNFRRSCERKAEELTSLGSLKFPNDQMKDSSHIRRVTSSEGKAGNQVCPVRDEDFEVSSDDEEADEKLRRQIFLEESEEQTEFLSVADDASSKEIFSLINRVTVTAIKPSVAKVHSEVHANVTGYHLSSLKHQPSFLDRKVTTVVATTRQGSGNSRSYVFGRDDSNSRDTNRSIDNQEQMLQTGKEKPSAMSSDEQRLNSTMQAISKGGSSIVKGREVKEEMPPVLSLFQVLKQQAADLASGKSSIGSNTSSSRAIGDLSIFSAIKSSRQSRGPRIP